MALPSPDRLFTTVRSSNRRPPKEPRERRPIRWPGVLRFVAVHPWWAALGAFVALTVLPVLVGIVVPPVTSSFMLQYRAERLASSEPMPALEHDWVSWGHIATAAKLALVAAEDQRFPEHFGFDVEAIEAAREHNRYSRRVRGASTISQQCAKNLFLWPGRSWIRKGFEVGYTLLLETFWSKKRILEVYLNVAEFGEGVYGVEAASQKFFRKPASMLTAREAALLAAVLPNPVRYKVSAPSAYVESRAAWIEGQMAQLGNATIDGL